MNNIEEKIQATNIDGIIKIELKNKDDYKNKFNNDRISKELTTYILNELKTVELKKQVTLIISSKHKLTDYEKEQLKKMITTTYQDDLFDIKTEYKMTLKYAWFFMIIGAIILLAYYLSNNLFFVSEYILIIGWLLIWESAGIILFGRGKTTIKQKRRKQLIHSNIIFR